MNNIRRVRRHKDITQHELSRRTTIPQSSLSLIERYYMQPTELHKEAIAKALNVKKSQLFP